MAHVRDAARPLLASYGTMRLEEFGIRELKTLREQLIERGLVRKSINDRVK